jgi:hypothetical protein
LAETDNWKDTKGGRKWVREYMNECYAVWRRLVATQGQKLFFKKAVVDSEAPLVRDPRKVPLHSLSRSRITILEGPNVRVRS